MSARGISRRTLTALASALGLAAAWAGFAGATPAHAASLPTPDHVVVVVMENHGYSQVVGSSSAPYAGWSTFSTNPCERTCSQP